MTFETLAKRINSGRELSLGEATFMIISWMEEAAEKIREATGENISSDVVVDDFRESAPHCEASIWWTGGDDDDMIDIIETGAELDRIVREQIHDITTRQTLARIKKERESDENLHAE